MLGATRSFLWREEPLGIDLLLERSQKSGTGVKCRLFWIVGSVECMGANPAPLCVLNDSGDCIGLQKKNTALRQETSCELRCLEAR